MNQIYSPRGLRRGLMLAGLSVGIWMAWAIGYSQGVDVNNSRMPLISIDEHASKEKR